MELGYNELKWLIPTVVIIAIIILIKRIDSNRHVINYLDLITDGKTGRLDYKKVALNTAAMLQCFTWLRMSLGYPIHSALEDPWMWVVFYAVIAGHDLLTRIVKIKAGDYSNESNTSNNGNSTNQ